MALKEIEYKNFSIDDLIGDKSVSVINSTTEKVYSSEVKNKTIYKRKHQRNNLYGGSLG